MGIIRRKIRYTFPKLTTKLPIHYIIAKISRKCWMNWRKRSRATCVKEAGRVWCRHWRQLFVWVEAIQARSYWWAVLGIRLTNSKKRWADIFMIQAKNIVLWPIASNVLEESLRSWCNRLRCHLISTSLTESSSTICPSISCRSIPMENSDIISQIKAFNSFKTWD